MDLDLRSSLSLSSVLALALDFDFDFFPSTGVLLVAGSSTGTATEPDEAWRDRPVTASCVMVCVDAIKATMSGDEASWRTGAGIGMAGMMRTGWRALRRETRSAG